MFRVIVALCLLSWALVVGLAYLALYEWKWVAVGLLACIAWVLLRERPSPPE